MRKIISVLLIIALTACVFSGCGDTVDKIADSVVQAARQELENQVKAVLEENKLEVIEVKTTFGKLNDKGSDLQFFVAALVRAEKTDLIQAALPSLQKAFSDCGMMAESDSNVDSAHLVHKSVTYSRSDFSGGNYYTVYAYYDDLTKFVSKNG